MNKQCFYFERYLLQTIASTRLQYPQAYRLNRRLVLYGLFLCITLALGGCADEQSRFAPIDKNSVIVAFGDSLTQGTGAKSTESYPAILAELSGHKVVNAGVAGEVSKKGLARLPEILSNHNPTLVILCHGGNDLLRKLGVEQLKENLVEMIRQIQERGAQVLLVGVPKPSLLLGPASVYQELENEHALVSELDIISTVLAKAGLKSDPVHPNAAGYRKIAEAIHKRLSDAGAY